MMRAALRRKKTTSHAKSATRWFVYIVKCKDGTLYTGVTTDVVRRIAEHNGSAKGAKYTRARRPVKLVRAERFKTRSAACIREAAIKKLPLAAKKALL